MHTSVQFNARDLFSWIYATKLLFFEDFMVIVSDYFVILYVQTMIKYNINFYIVKTYDKDKEIYHL